MKISPQEHQLALNLGPSKFSADGFMDAGDLPIDELILADKRKVEKLGVGLAYLVSGLESVYFKAQQAFGAEIELGPNLCAQFFESRGKIPSPFPGHGVFEKGETVLWNLIGGNRIVITKLGIAMIKSFSFFEGLNSRYRIDPVVLTKFLGVIN